MKSRKNMRKAAVWLSLFLVVAVLGLLLFTWSTHVFYKAIYPVKYAQLVEENAAAYQLEPAFVYAVIKAESDFQSDAVSNADAIGLMQIQEDTFSWAMSRIGETRTLIKDDLFVPEINIQYGCAIYSILIEEFGSERTAIAAYHAGWGNVQKWLSDSEYTDGEGNLLTTPFASTNQYMEKILQVREIYNNLYGFSSK